MLVMRHMHLDVIALLDTLGAITIIVYLVFRGTLFVFSRAVMSADCDESNMCGFFFKLFNGVCIQAAMYGSGLHRV